MRIHSRLVIIPINCRLMRIRRNVCSLDIMNIIVRYLCSALKRVSSAVNCAAVISFLNNIMNLIVFNQMVISVIADCLEIGAADIVVQNAVAAAFNKNRLTRFYLLRAFEKQIVFNYIIALCQRVNVSALKNYCASPDIIKPAILDSAAVRSVNILPLPVILIRFGFFCSVNIYSVCADISEIAVFNRNIIHSACLNRCTARAFKAYSFKWNIIIVGNTDYRISQRRYFKRSVFHAVGHVIIKLHCIFINVPFRRHVQFLQQIESFPAPWFFYWCGGGFLNGDSCIFSRWNGYRLFLSIDRHRRGAYIVKVAA